MVKAGHNGKLLHFQLLAGLRQRGLGDGDASVRGGPAENHESTKTDGDPPREGLPCAGRRPSPAGADDDPVLSSFKSIEVELSGIVASLSKLPLSELWPDHALLKPWEWLETLSQLDVLNFALDNYEGLFLPIGRWRRLLPGPCFTDAWLTKNAPKVLHNIEHQLHLVKAFWAQWSSHLLLADIDPATPSSSSSYTVEVEIGENVLLVGNGCAVRKLLRWSADDRGDHRAPRVISFVGPAGVGKTALAMEVYRQLQITCDFQCCATANMSHKPDVDKLLLHILSQIDKPTAVELESSIQRSESTTAEDSSIQRSATARAEDSSIQKSAIATPDDPFPELLVLDRCLQNKRYLIMIDDIWNVSDWDVISNIFSESNCWGSQIIITTQVRSVANSICSTFDGLVHEVHPLNQLDSERLFHIKACFNEDLLPDNLKRSRDEILKVCGGIPLLISGMAGWLKEQPLYTNYSAEKGPQLLKQFEHTFSATYDVLPYHLKELLLYMSMFPHGYMFDKDNLIKKWIIKQLIVYHGESFDPMEKAEQYFCELVDRNIIVTKAANCKEAAQVEVEEARQWQVNYFMLQFLASESANKGFACTSGALASVAGGIKKARPLYLYQDQARLLQNMDLSHTRLLVVSGSAVSRIPFEMFIPLVVLDLEGWGCFKEDQDLPVICRMVLLRYLSLKNTHVSELPMEMMNLSSLEVLDISYTWISELPPHMSALRLLHTLDVRGTPVKQLPTLEGLKHLLIGGSEQVNNHEEIVTQLLRDKFPDNHQQGSCGRSVKRCFLKKKKKKLEDISERILTLGTVECSSAAAGAAGVVSSLCHMSSLRSLAITCSFQHCSDGEFRRALWSCISRVKSLRSLTIHCGACCELIESLSDEDWVPSTNLDKFKVKGGRFFRIPGWLRCHRGLAYIEITVGKLVQDDLISILGNLPTLECLVLGVHFLPEKAIVIQRGAFVSLESFSVTSRLPWLAFGQGAMPALTRLELKIAGSLASEESVPSGIGHLWTLSEVAIHYDPLYANSPSVKIAVKAIRKQVADHCNLVINGIQKQEEEEPEEDDVLLVIDHTQDQEEDVVAMANRSPSEIEIVDTSQLNDQQSTASTYSCSWYP